MARPKLDRPKYRLRRNRSGYFAVTWTEEGKTRSASTGQTNEKLAKVWRDQFAELDQKESIPDEPTVSVISDGYYEWRKDDVARPENLEFSLRPIKRELGNLTPALLSQETIKRYAVARRDKANDTIRRELKCLHAALRWSGRHWNTTPFEFDMPVPPSRPRDRWLTKDEARKLLEAVTLPHVKIFTMLALMTAQRGIAICDLTWNRVDFDHGIINFGDNVGKKRRATVPMNSQLRAALLEARELRTTDYVVEYREGQVKNPRKGVASAARRAGLGKLGKHALRHTAATWMIMDGRPKAEVADYLGTTIAMIERVYGHLSPDFLRDASKALEL